MREKCRVPAIVKPNDNDLASNRIKPDYPTESRVSRTYRPGDGSPDKPSVAWIENSISTVADRVADRWTKACLWRLTLPTYAHSCDVLLFRIASLGVDLGVWAIVEVWPGSSPRVRGV